MRNQAKQHYFFSPKQFPSFCSSGEDGEDVNPLFSNGEFVTCDGLTKGGCPEGFSCLISALDFGPNAPGFCCPKMGEKT